MPYIEILKEHVIFEALLRNNKNIKSPTCCTTHAMDVGALTPSLGFRGTRKTYEFYERVSVLECMQHTFARAECLMIPIGLLNDIILS
jgi:hypothetical protein